MKNSSFVILILSGFLFGSCQKVIDVKLAAEPPRLVVDAALIWVKGTNGKTQSITLSTTSGYFSSEIPKVSGATVFVNNSANTKFDFIEESTQKGKYTCKSFSPVIGETYTLTVITNGETYKGNEKLIASTTIESVEQRNDLGINSDEYGIKTNFQDSGAQTNFYLLSYTSPVSPFPYLEVIDDIFFQGNKAFGLFGNDKLKKGDEVQIKFREVSERYFNYMKLLTGTAAGGGGGPFQPSPASTIKGNMVNQTNARNFCLGYFSVNEVDSLLYTIK